MFSYLLQRFKDNDIEVKRKDGIILLRELAAEVKNFMDFKRNAVMVSGAANMPYHGGTGGGEQGFNVLEISIHRSFIHPFIPPTESTSSWIDTLTCRTISK